MDQTDITVHGETVSEEKEPAPKPKFTVDAALDWLRDPKNEPKIREWSAKTDASIREVVKLVDKSVTETAHLIKDALEDKSVGENIVDDLLGRLGFKGDDE